MRGVCVCVWGVSVCVRAGGSIDHSAADIVGRSCVCLAADLLQGVAPPAATQDNAIAAMVAVSSMVDATVPVATGRSDELLPGWLVCLGSLLASDAGAVGAPRASAPGSGDSGAGEASSAVWAQSLANSTRLLDASLVGSS